jgi:threonine dehydratase
MFTLAELEAALGVVHAAMPPTPQFAWPLLRQRTGVDVVVKHENHTPTGAFKVRGGLVYADRLKRDQPPSQAWSAPPAATMARALPAAARTGIAATIVCWAVRWRRMRRCERSAPNCWRPVD